MTKSEMKKFAVDPEVLTAIRREYIPRHSSLLRQTVLRGIDDNIQNFGKQLVLDNAGELKGGDES